VRTLGSLEKHLTDEMSPTLQSRFSWRILVRKTISMLWLPIWNAAPFHPSCPLRPWRYEFPPSHVSSLVVVAILVIIIVIVILHRQRQPRDTDDPRRSRSRFGPRCDRARGASSSSCRGGDRFGWCRPDEGSGESRRALTPRIRPPSWWFPTLSRLDISQRRALVRRRIEGERQRRWGLIVAQQTRRSALSCRRERRARRSGRSEGEALAEAPRERGGNGAELEPEPGLGAVGLVIRAFCVSEGRPRRMHRRPLASRCVRSCGSEKAR